MIKELIYAAKYVLGKDLAGRNLTVFPDDTFIVSYPRSGNTWMRFLVANLLHPGDTVSFANLERLVPDIHAQSKRFLNRVPRPRVLKSHEYFDARYRRVLYMVRDPRDVVVSSYHFHRKQRQIAEAYPLESYVSDFLAGAVFQTYASWGENTASWLAATQVGAGRQDGSGLFGSWGENAASWLTSRQGDKEFLLLRYEDMLPRPEAALAGIARFFRVEATAERLTTAVERSSLTRMRRLEKDQAEAWVLTKGTRQDIPFVGGLRGGGWKTSLSSKAASDIERAWGPLMKQLAYL